MEHLYDKLVKYSVSDYYGFHMPGHKRQQITGAEKLPYEIDITEIEGFDDLHHAEDLFINLQEYAAEVFHAEETHYFECSTWMYRIRRQDFDGEKLS